MCKSLIDRLEGCLIGGALGDAIGACYEGKKPIGDIEIPVTLQVTDDTQLTLATWDAILDSEAVIPQAIAASFVRWFRERRITGIGSSTLKALTELAAGGHWATAGAVGERAAGNGAAMRIAPLAFLLNPHDEHHRQTIRDVCRITHCNDEAYIGALAVVYSLHAIFEPKFEVSDLNGLLVEKLPDSCVRDRLIFSDRLTEAEYVEEFGASGYVADSVPFAILALSQSLDFSEGVATIVKCGGDTDTNASIFGQLFGAARGIHSIPEELRAKLNCVDEIQRITERFAMEFMGS